MSARLNYLHAQYALRRELEHNRVQATQEVNRYYDHWGKVTSRFENWTNQDYYDKAERKLQTKRDKQQKELELTERRKQLRTLFQSEQEAFDRELKPKTRPHRTAGESATDLQMLERVNQSLKEREQIKRKLEMEAKLYGRWRHGVDDEKLLYESKTDNQTLAKLNWLDKQIENQLQREQEEALAAERQLQLQQEISRTEQAQKERQLIREQEIKDIRALQETHMTELKKRQEESEKLKEEEKHLTVFLDELGKEEKLIEESTNMVLQRPDLAQAFNLKKIKLFIRNRSETYRKQIKLCIHLLERMHTYAVKTENLEKLLAKYKEQNEAEDLACAQIDSMYESEAKYNLQRFEDNWHEKHLQRYNEIKELIQTEHGLLSAMRAENLAQQQELIELRSRHLAGLEVTNKQLEQLSQEEEQAQSSAAASPRAVESALPVAARDSTTQLAVRPVSSQDELIPKVSNSFSNLNLDCWQNMPAVRGGCDSPRLNKTRSMNVVSENDAVPPKFARKRVAWT